MLIARVFPEKNITGIPVIMKKTEKKVVNQLVRDVCLLLGMSEFELPF